MLSYIVRSVIQMAGRSRVTAAGSQEKDPGWRDTGTLHWQADELEQQLSISNTALFSKVPM